MVYLGIKRLFFNLRDVMKTCMFPGPDSLVVRTFTSGAVGRVFAPLRRHTKGGKNGTGSFLADARNKRVVPGRYKKAGGYS